MKLVADYGVTICNKNEESGISKVIGIYAMLITLFAHIMLTFQFNFN